MPKIIAIGVALLCLAPRLGLTESMVFYESATPFATTIQQIWGNKMPVTTSTLRLKRRRTKIVATLGPASCAPEMVTALIEAGVNMFRVNMSHGEHATHRTNIETVKAMSAKLGVYVAILGDLCGPKIRVGEFRDGSISLEDGADVTVTTRRVVGEPGLIPSQYEPLARDLKVGQSILLADGLMSLRVNRIEDTEIYCTVERGGELYTKKGMNLPGVKLSVPSLTEKDRRDADFALEAGVDALALSFVRQASDVDELRALCQAKGSDVWLIAKIEKPEAIEDIDAILAVSDGIMVARGDLGVEMPAEQVPLLQDELVRLAREHNCPVIVATQMLESMIEHGRPTRAEVSDVSHAVSSGADAVMLSGETAVGRHPVEAVKTMDRIARQTEGYLWSHGAFGSISTSEERGDTALSVPDALGNATSLLSRELQVRAIVVPSTSGSTAKVVSAARPAAPLLAVSHLETTCRRLCMVWGVIPLHTSLAQMQQSPALARELATQLQLTEKGQHLLLVEGFHPDPALRAPSLTVLVA